MLLHPCVVIVSPVNLKKISDGQLVLWPWPLPLRPQLLEAELPCYTSNVTKPPPRFLLWEERDTPVSLCHYWLDFQQRKTERRESKALCSFFCTWTHDTSPPPPSDITEQVIILTWTPKEPQKKVQQPLIRSMFRRLHIHDADGLLTLFLWTTHSNSRLTRLNEPEIF